MRHGPRRSSGGAPPHGPRPATARRRPLTALVVALLSTSAAAELPPENADWLATTSEHFAVLSDGRRGLVEEVARNLEALHRLLEELQQVDRRGPRTQVFAFRRSRDFATYSPWERGTRIAGFFATGRLRNVISIDLQKDLRAGRGGATAGTVYHELLHDFAATHLPGIPLWLNEGLAEVYSTFEIVEGRDGAYAEVGRPVREHIYRLRSSRLLPTERIVAVDSRSPEYGGHGSGDGADTRGVFYAQSWAMAHLLVTDPDRVGELPRFLTLLAEGDDVQSAFVEAFGSFESFHRDLERYVDGASFSYGQIPLTDLGITEGDDTVDAVRTVGRAEVLTRLGELLAAQRAVGPAREHLTEALRLETEGAARADGGGPSAVAAEAHAVLGWLDWETGDRAGARVHLAAAAERADAVLPRLYRGAFELDAVMESAPLAVPGTSAAAEAVIAQDVLREALALRPAWPDVLVQLGLTFLYHGDPAEGLELLGRAVEARPADPLARLGLAVLSARAGDTDRAWLRLEQMDRLVRRTPQSVSRDALLATGRRAVVTFHVNRVVELYNLGRTAEALEGAADLEERLRAADLEEDLQRVREILLRIRSEVARDEAVESFNRAVTLARSGSYRSALDVLDDLLSRDGLDAEVERRARELRGQVSERLGNGDG